jgi:hypothetical protein
MKPYKLTDKDITKIQKEFEKSLKKYNNAAQPFYFNYTPKPTTTTKKKIKLYCLPTAWCKMMTLVQKTSTEIAWHMLIEKTSKTSYVISDVLVYPQTVTGATVNTDDTKYALWVNDLSNEDFNKMRGQGHSHVNMGVSPSGVDTGYYNDLLSTMSKGYYIFMILNKREDMFLQLVDLDTNVIYDSSDIIFEVATKQWSQTKWYETVTKQITKYIPNYLSNYTKNKKDYANAYQTRLEDKQEDLFYGLDETSGLL